MNEILDLLKDNMIVFVVTTILSLIPIFGTLIGKFLSAKIKNIKIGQNFYVNELLQNLAENIVIAIEQKYKTLSNNDKFDKAFKSLSEKISKLLGDKKIEKTIKPNDIEEAIEKAVYNMKLNAITTKKEKK